MENFAFLLDIYNPAILVGHLLGDRQESHLRSFRPPWRLLKPIDPLRGFIVFSATRPRNITPRIYFSRRSAGGCASLKAIAVWLCTVCAVSTSAQPLATLRPGIPAQRTAPAHSRHLFHLPLQEPANVRIRAVEAGADLLRIHDARGKVLCESDGLAGGWEVDSLLCGFPQAGMYRLDATVRSR